MPTISPAHRWLATRLRGRHAWRRAKTRYTRVRSAGLQVSRARRCRRVVAMTNLPTIRSRRRWTIWRRSSNRNRLTGQRPKGSSVMQNLAWVSSLVLMAVVAALFLWVVAGASRAGEAAGAMAKVAYQWRGRLFWIVIAAGVVVSFATLWKWPIAGHAAAGTKPDVTIRAVGHQWRWELDKDTVPVGKLVEFELTASDVNH